MKMPEADWKVKLYFAEVKEVLGKKYYLCYPLDPNENGNSNCIISYMKYV
jgi:hypothetical protein